MRQALLEVLHSKHGHNGLKSEPTVEHVEVVVSLADISVNFESEMIKIHRI